ncbi:MAG: septal ring lytic transglycosylase RlpA family protein [Deltaproteobacteria bacterium]|nr:septal ring lytic transglycosylase RlpA family protein [Deltaproteobacteria bacterium]
MCKKILFLTGLAILAFLNACAFPNKQVQSSALKLPTKEDALNSFETEMENSNLVLDSLQEGFASWYGPGFYGRRTASGEVFRKQAFTAAHRSLPFGTRLKVVNENNGKEVEVTVNDRGPFIKGRILDLSYAAARELGILKPGHARVSLFPLLAKKEGEDRER